MAAIGGSIESISLNSREFAVAADAEAQRKLGGFENEVMANGNPTARIIKTRVPLALNGVTIVVDDDRGDHEFVQELADSNEFFPIAITYASGETYQGEAQFTGELQASSQSTTMPINLMGPGKLTKQ
jgi:hypothetical protein